MPKAPTVVKRANPAAAKARRDRRRRYDLIRKDAPGRALYRTKRWRDVLRPWTLQMNPFCVTCLAIGRETPTAEIDHVVPHEGDADLFFDRGNLQGLCYRCHVLKTKREVGPASPLPMWLKPSAIPVTIVCGPPGSGKTTLVGERAGDRDIILDLDEIKAEISGLPLYRAGAEWLERALTERNRRLATLAHLTGDRRAWFIVGAPRAAERKTWKRLLRADAVEVLPVSPGECSRRIESDPRRADQLGRWDKLIDDWWRAYRLSWTPDKAA